jgi:hypothetical protein
MTNNSQRNVCPLNVTAYLMNLITNICIKRALYYKSLLMLKKNNILESFSTKDRINPV